MTRILLFEAENRGHSEAYLRRFVDGLHGDFDVVLAVTRDLGAALDDVAAEVVALPAGSATDPATQTEAFLDAALQVGADHAVHMFADGVLWHLLRQRRASVPVTVFVFRPRALLYGAQLTPRERVRAAAHDLVLSAWRLRPDGHAVLTLDGGAASRWAGRPGAPAFWLPEPPVSARPPNDVPARSGCVLYGVLAPRKGIHLLADAVASAPTAIDIVLAGPVDPPYRTELPPLIARMRESGARVELRDYRHTEEMTLDLFARARCALLPYPRHYGISRSLLEASTAGTPILAHDGGLVGHLVRSHGLGQAVDCTDPSAFRSALLTMTGSDGDSDRYAVALARYARRSTPGRFAAVLRGVFADGSAARER